MLVKSIIFVNGGKYLESLIMRFQQNYLLKFGTGEQFAASDICAVKFSSICLRSGNGHGEFSMRFKPW